MDPKKAMAILQKLGECRLHRADGCLRNILAESSGDTQDLLGAFAEHSLSAGVVQARFVPENAELTVMLFVGTPGLKLNAPVRLLMGVPVDGGLVVGPTTVDRATIASTSVVPSTLLASYEQLPQQAASRLLADVFAVMKPLDSFRLTHLRMVEKGVHQGKWVADVAVYLVGKDLDLLKMSLDSMKRRQEVGVKFTQWDFGNVATIVDEFTERAATTAEGAAYVGFVGRCKTAMTKLIDPTHLTLSMETQASVLAPVMNPYGHSYLQTLAEENAVAAREAGFQVECILGPGGRAPGPWW